MIFPLLALWAAAASSQPLPWVSTSPVSPTYLALAPNLNDFSRFADGGPDANWYIGFNNAWIVKLPPAPMGEYVRAFIGAKIGRAKTRPNPAKPWLRETIDGKIYVGLAPIPTFSSEQSYFLVESADIPLEPDPQAYVEGAGAAEWFWAEVPVTAINFTGPNFLAVWSPTKFFVRASSAPILAASPIDEAWGLSHEPRAWNNHSISGVPPRVASTALETPINSLSPAIAIKLIPQRTDTISITEFAARPAGKNVIADFTVSGDNIMEAWVELSQDQLDWKRISPLRRRPPYSFTLKGESLPRYGAYLRGGAKDEGGNVAQGRGGRLAEGPVKKGLKVSVVGATGMVGRELLLLLEKSRVPVASLAGFSSGRERKFIRFHGRTLPAPAVDPKILASSDLVFLVSSDDVSLELAPKLAARGVWVIDDSAAFRLDPKVPLVIPEVNARALTAKTRLIAGPNCTMTGLAVAAAELHRKFGVTEARIASYQAVSGAGQAALAELDAQLSGGPLNARALPRPIAGNVFPQVGRFDADGHSSEERKVAAELKKVWNAPRLKASVTAVRVPVKRGHSLAAWLTFRKPVSPAQARRVMAQTPGLVLSKDGDYPTPHSAAHTGPVYAGRVRQGATKNELCLWIVSDNLLKGAALNSVQVAEALLARGWLAPARPARS
jgi:aspartate-semialdehyde dehydrogenase